MSYEIPRRQQLLLPRSQPPRHPPISEFLNAEFPEEDEDYEEISDYFQQPDDLENDQKPQNSSHNQFLGRIFGISFSILLLIIISLIVSAAYYYSTLLEYVSKESKLDEESESESYCSTGYTWFELTGYCYKASMHTVPFENAEAICQSDQAHLASIHSEVENIFITGLYHTDFQKNRSASKVALWIGLHRFNKSWEWLDGSPMDYENWRYNGQKTRESGKATIGYAGNQWMVHNAEGKLGFVCKKVSLLAGNTLPSVSLSTTDTKHCIKGYDWFEATKSCYAVFTDQKNLKNAQKSCEEDNANLVSVHSEVENSFLNGLMMRTIEYNKGSTLPNREDFWIGLIAKNRNYGWIDGLSAKFFYWWPAEPKYTTRENYFRLTYWFAWRPTDPSFVCGYICKMDGKFID